MGETCSVCGVAVAGSDVLYAPDGRVVCPKHFAEIDPSAGSVRSPWRMSAIAGGIAGAIPFGIHMSSSSVSSVNGHVTSFVYRDWIAIICGVIAAILGVMTVLAARKEQLQRALAFAAGIGVLALGGVQVARGLGVFESPSASADSSESVSVTTDHPAADEPPAPEAPPPAAAPPSGAAAFEAACDKGSADGCYDAGHWYAQMSQADKAVPLYKRGCDGGNLKACSELGFSYSEGQGVDKDPGKGKEIYEKTCAAGHAFSCTRLGLLYSEGKVVKLDKKKAFDLFIKSCDMATDADGGTGCDIASDMLNDGDGVKADKKRGAALRDKACKLDKSYCKDATPK